MSQAIRLEHEYGHLELPIDSRPLVYGPLNLAPYGDAIGVNLLGAKKICSYNCVYCELGRTETRLNQVKSEDLFPPPQDVDSELRKHLRPLAQKNLAAPPIVISGFGEPTLHPRFSECIELVIRARNELSRGTPILVMTNGAHLDQKKINDALNLVDHQIIKLDAGQEKLFRGINDPLTRSPLEKMVQSVGGLSSVVIRSMFIAGLVNNTEESQIDDWLELLGLIKPSQVQIETLTRVPWKSGISAVDDMTLYGIAAKVKRKLQIEATVLV